MKHPVCSRCQVEALRLIEYRGEEYCDACVPLKHLGPPFRPGSWETLKRRLVAR